MEIYVAGLKLQTSDDIFSRGTWRSGATWEHLIEFMYVVWSDLSQECFGQSLLYKCTEELGVITYLKVMLQSPKWDTWKCVSWLLI